MAKQFHRHFSYMATKRKDAWRRLTLDLLIYMIILVGVLIFWTVMTLASIGMRTLFENTHFLDTEGNFLPTEQIESYNIPNPCELATVICEVEEPEEIVSYGTIREVTAYTSRPEETDDTPCVSASGDDICDLHNQGTMICAANFVPIGTTLAIDGIPGHNQFTCLVLDRMNSRYQNRVDIYYGMDTESALQFGRRNLPVEQL